MTDKGSIHSKEIEDSIHEQNQSADKNQPPGMPASLAILTDVEYAKIKRQVTLKLDARIMPCMVVMYIMNYLDRQNIAAAKLANIDHDLNMTDVQYQTCISILFVGYSMLRV
jgi:hypothetical protein